MMVIKFSQKEISDILIEVASERTGYTVTALQFHFYLGVDRQHCLECEMTVTGKEIAEPPLEVVVSPEKGEG